MPTQVAKDFCKILALALGVGAAFKVEPSKAQDVFLARWVDILMASQRTKKKPGLLDRAKDAAERQLMLLRLRSQLQSFQKETGISIDVVARISAGIFTFASAKLALRIVLR